MVAAPPGQPVLVYNRIAHNRRKTWFLASLAIAAVIPFILGISFIVSAGVVARVSPHTRSSRAQIRWEEDYLRNAPEVSSDARARIERRLEEQRQALAGQQEADSLLRLELMCVVAAGLIAIMGILFWELPPRQPRNC